MGKKGQLQIQETILVIFIFSVILIIGISLFYRYTINSIKQDGVAYDDFRFMAGISSIPSMPEIRCSTLGVQKDWIDLEKAKAFTYYSRDYYSIFGYSNITLYVVYPATEDKAINLYFRRPSSSSDKLRISTPILVYDSIDLDYKVGKLVMERYK